MNTFGLPEYVLPSNAFLDKVDSIAILMKIISCSQNATLFKTKTELFDDVQKIVVVNGDEITTHREFMCAV